MRRLNKVNGGIILQNYMLGVIVGFRSILWFGVCVLHQCKFIDRVNRFSL